MRDLKYPGLPNILLDGLKATRIDLAAEVSAPEQPLLWPRPPFYSDLGLGGQPVQAFLNCITNLSLDELAGAYAQIIRMYVTCSFLKGRGNLHEWVWRYVLTDRDARMLFTPSEAGPRHITDHREIYKNVVQFAALMSYHGGELIASNEKNFVVQVGARLYGVQNGGILSGEAGGIILKTTRGLCRNGVNLADTARQGPPRSRVSPDLVRVRQLLLQEGAMTPALNIALLALAWRATSHPLMRLRKAVDPRQGVTALRDACREASDFRKFTQPLLAMRAMFVPQFMSREKFHDLFGHPTQKNCLVSWGETLLQKYADRWDATLEELSPGYQLEK